MTQAQRRARRIRLGVLITGSLFTVAGLTWAVLPYLNEFFDLEGEESFWGLMGTPLSPIQFSSEYWNYTINLILVLGIVLLAQWAFLRPGKKFGIRMLTEGRPLKTSVFAAALMACLLTTGAVALILEIPDWWQPLQGDEDDWLNPVIILSVMAIIWGVWTCIFWRYWKQGDRYTQLGKMIRGLIAGSMLEVMIAVPVHIWAARQRDCYCCRGTYTTLVLAGTVLIWAFGPGIILLYWREKDRREKLIEQHSSENSI